MEVCFLGKKRLQTLQIYWIKDHSLAQIFLSVCVNVEVFKHVFFNKEEKETATQVEYENIYFSTRVIKSCFEKYDLLMAVSNPQASLAVITQ